MADDNDVVRLREFYRSQTETREIITESEKNILHEIGELSRGMAVTNKTACDAEETANKAMNEVNDLKLKSARGDKIVGGIMGGVLVVKEIIMTMIGQ